MLTCLECPGMSGSVCSLQASILTMLRRPGVTILGDLARISLGVALKIQAQSLMVNVFFVFTKNRKKLLNFKYRLIAVCRGI